jgi:hypothetical protein
LCAYWPGYGYYGGGLYYRHSAPAAVLQKAKQGMAAIVARREVTARRIADALGVKVPA